MTVKTVNYTPEMVSRLHAVYSPEATESEREAQILDLSAELGKNVASIRAKLTSEGLYVPKTKAPAGKATIRKAQLVAIIAHKLNVAEEMVESLEKANKAVLARIAQAL